MLDGDRNHIEDALIELWQADSAGRYHHPADDRARRAARSGVHAGSADAPATSRPARTRSSTIKPGPVPHPNGGMQAPHVSLTIQARGMLNPTFTRVYFDDEAAANATDPGAADRCPRPADRR